MEKTAMQIAIDWMLSDSFKVENLTRFDVSKKLIELKEVEKKQLDELQKQRDELLDCLISVIPIGEMKTFDEIDRNYKSAKELIKKYKS